MSKYFKVLMLSLCSFSLSYGMKVADKNIIASDRLGQIALYHQDKDFFIKLKPRGNNKASTSCVIQRYNVDEPLRGITKESLKKILGDNAYLSIKDMGKDNYGIQLCYRLNGGGFGGATAGFYIGKFVVHFVAHGAILVASACTGPAAPATFAALEACALPHIIVAAEVGSLAGGMIGAVATGPV